MNEALIQDNVDEFDGDTRDTNAQIMRNCLTPEVMQKIADLGGPTRSQILSWVETTRPGNITDAQKRVVGFVTGYSSSDLSCALLPETALANGTGNAHWGHIGIRIAGDIRWYPISKYHFSVMDNEIENRSSIFLGFYSQNDKIVYVNRAHVEEIAFVSEAEEWHDSEEWMYGGGYGAEIKGRDEWALIYDWIQGNTHAMTPEMVRHLDICYQDKRDLGILDRTFPCDKATVIAATTFSFVPSDACMTDITNALDFSHGGNFKFTDQGSVTRYIPADLVRLIELPYSRSHSSFATMISGVFAAHQT